MYVNQAQRGITIKDSVTGKCSLRLQEGVQNVRVTVAEKQTVSRSHLVAL